MNRSVIFYAALGAAVIALALAVYYIIPGYTHILVSSDPTKGHIKHALAFGAVAVVCVIAALVTRPKSAARS